MKNSRLMVALTLLACVALQTGCGGNDPKPRGEKIQLQLNLAKGASYKLMYDMDMDISASAQGQTMKMDMTMGFGMSMNVDDVTENGIHTITTKYDSVKMNMTGMGQSIKYDSSSDKAPPAGMEALTELLKVAMTIDMDRKGKVLKVSGLDGGGIMGEQKQQFEQMMSQAFGTYPDQPVDIRDSWRQTLNMAAQPQMPMTMDVTYTLYDRQNGKAIIKVDGTLKATGQADLDGTMEGEIIISEKTGWTEKANMTMDISGTVAGGGKMDMQGKITITGQ